MVREAAVASEEILRLAPVLRAELDRLDLGRVLLFVAPKAKGYQGMFQVTGEGGMEITIAASMDPMKTRAPRSHPRAALDEPVHPC